MPAITGEELDALQAANQLLILRAAFVAEERFMPPITSIKQALRLRKDPYLGAIREQLQIFHNGLMRGDQNVVVAARREIQKAQRRLERRAGWDKILRWLTYCAVPAGIVESLVPILPVASVSLSIIGAAGAAASRRTEEKNQWVLFGS
jgi:hypothetical protein